MNIFLVGGTGYIGKEVLRQLIVQKHNVTILLRRESENKLAEEIKKNISLVYGEVEKPETYQTSLKNCTAIINLLGIIREFPHKGITFEKIHFEATKILVDEAKKVGVKRFLQMSALGVKPNAKTLYQQTKYRAEEYIKQNDLQWTIFRPSVVFGNEKSVEKNFLNVIKDLHSLMPFFVPIVGNGKYRFQPIAVHNLAEGIVASLSTEKSIGVTYDVAGPHRYSFNQLVNIVGSAIRKKKIQFHQPMFMMKILASLFGRYEFFPISKDQITMLEEENITENWKKFFDDFSITPKELEKSIMADFS